MNREATTVPRWAPVGMTRPRYQRVGSLLLTGRTDELLAVALTGHEAAEFCRKVAATPPDPMADPTGPRPGRAPRTRFVGPGH